MPNWNTNNDVRLALKRNPHLKAGGSGKASIPERNPEPMTRKPWSDSELSSLRDMYSQFWVNIEEFAVKHGRTFHSVALKASRLGIAGERGKHNRRPETIAKNGQVFRDMTSEERSRNTKEWIAKNGHPRGFLGGKHSNEAKNSISAKLKGRKRPEDQVLKMLKTKAANGTMAPTWNGRSWKSAWRTIGGKRIFARSRWEANYARYLQFLKEAGEILEWEHEPETFWFEKIKRGARSYLPDFRVTLSSGVQFHEVKGWMDSRSKTKIKRMRIYHPSVVLIVRDASWFKANSRNLKQFIQGWEQ